MFKIFTVLVDVVSSSEDLFNTHESLGLLIDISEHPAKKETDK